jgi:LacI family transcriptional regulator
VASAPGKRSRSVSDGRVVTLADVARRAGVSVATASRVLHGSSTRRVRPELSTKVVEAAAALDYLPNLQAQAVARGRTDVVGLVVHDIADPYFSTIAAGAMRAADERRLTVTLGSTLRSPQRELEYVATLRAQRARAVILAGSRFADRGHIDQLAGELDAFRASGGRVAVISQHRLGVDTVMPENRAGARSLARELLALGHRRFAVLAGPTSLLTARDRLAGFKEGLREQDITLEREDVLHGAFTRDGGYEAAAQLLDRASAATCVFAVNDVMAVGAMAAMRERGVTVGRELSVAGFDDIAWLRDVTPALTTVRMPLEQMGADAVRMVLDDEPSEPRVLRVHGKVVLRESTARF